MERILLTLVILAIPSVACASTTYTGNLVVPAGSTITFTGAGSGCATINSSGVLVPAACPQGTAAFSAGTNITITGTNPYTINCPNCFQTTGGTITGNSTFSGFVTFSNNVVAAQYKSTVPQNGDAFALPSSASSGYTNIGSYSAQVNGVAANLLGIGDSGIGLKVGIDTGGDAGFLGQVTSTQFNISSKRAWKQDIQPLSLDALEVLHNVCWSSYRYRPGHGDPAQTHIGFIADCAPSILSGKKHDHFDIEAVSTVDALAILQLDTQIKVLYLIVIALTALLVLFAAALGLVARGKTL